MSMCTQAYDCIFRQRANKEPQQTLKSKHFERPLCIKGRIAIRLKKQISNNRRDEPGEFMKVFFHVVIVTSDNSYAAQRVILFAPTVALQPAVS